jgi:hypothetical protein
MPEVHAWCTLNLILYFIALVAWDLSFCLMTLRRQDLVRFRRQRQKRSRVMQVRA